MANLFWKTKRSTTSLLATPFKTEEEFERFIFETPEILEDIFLLKRQIRGGGKQGIPDIVGIDNDGNICIIEMKNVTVGASIIPQVLQYAVWAETSPDAIKALWLESDTRPADVTPAWDDLGIRIIVLAPTILRTTLHIVEKISYPVDLVEVKRWADGPNTFVLVNVLEGERAPKVPSATGLGPGDYGPEIYIRQYGERRAREFLRYAGQLERLIRDNGWSLERKNNKQYCGFKAGFFNAFGINWIGGKTFALFVKLPEAEAKSVGPKMTRYEPQWKQAVYFIEPGRTRVADFKPLLEKAYRRLTGD